LQAGVKKGFPIFHCHGSGSSRLESSFLDEIAVKNDVRLIGIDRPGIGYSDATDDYQVLDWPDDVEEIANQLNVDKFGIIGVSAGGPYALACAYKIPHRLTSCGLVSTLSPTNLILESGPIWMKLFWWIAKNYPKIVKRYLEITLTDKMREKVAKDNYINKFSFMLSKSDKKLLSNSDIQKTLADVFSESYRQGAKAGRDTALILSQYWGFDPNEVKLEKIYLWHGKKDNLMPIKPAKLLAESIPNCKYEFYENEGHFSLLINYAT
jgi:pimeloyl-ACP methyl ester carboxylesterase